MTVPALESAVMSKILITYASKHGHTGKIASRMADRIRERGAEVALHDVAAAPVPRPAEYDVVIVGASIHAGHHQHDVVEWVRHHASDLNDMPSAFFSVCLTAADDTDEAREASRGYVDALLDATGWQAPVTATFAGAVQYLEYDFMTRLLMRLLMARGHHDTDTSRDHEYTDWDAVDRFVDDCLALLPAAVTSG